MNYPQVFGRTCDDCKRWLFDEKTGAVKRTKERPGYPSKPIERPRQAPTPCHKCPKISPSHASEYEWSDRNKATWALYVETKAFSGANLTEAMRTDPIVLQNLTEIEYAINLHERSVARETMTSTQKAIPRKKAD